MPEENIDQREEREESRPAEESATVAPDNSQQTPPARSPRRIFTRRNFFFSLTAIGALIVLLIASGYFAFRYGYVDTYIKNQFTTKMSDFGITFTADVFRTTVSPISLELKNATFNDKLTGEKLFHIDSARLGISITDLYSWQLSRTLQVDTTDIDGLQAYVKFDENGKSNFSNINIVTEEGRLKFVFSSAKVSLKNGLVSFNDVQRKIAADGKNLVLALEPEDPNVPEDQKRFKFDLTSTESTFTYDEKTFEPINLHLKGVGNGMGVEIADLNIKSPLGEATLTGNITDLKLPKYEFKIDSTVDLMRAADVLPNGTVLRGIGTFSGTVTGEGEKYKVVGDINSASLAAANVTLKKLQVNATVEGENSLYNANGKAIAEMLTFEDFRIDFPQLIGNVRGNGTNFKWVGELQAAAARTPAGTLSGLYVSDAVAEYEDKRFDANFGNVMAKRFLSEDADVTGLQARNIKLSNFNDATNISLPNIRANNVKVKGAEISGVNASNIQVKDQGSLTTVGAGTLRADRVRTEDADIRGVTTGNVRVQKQRSRTNVTAPSVRAESLSTKDAQVRNLSANGVNVTDYTGGATEVRVNNLQAGGVNTKDVKVGNLTATNVGATLRGNQTSVTAGNLRVASVTTNAAVLGSLNVAGVRLSIRQGRIEGSSNDINAGTVKITDSAIPGGGTLENVVASKPVFVLEPSGRYRASLDMSLGGGVLGSVNLGAASANVVATSEQVELNNLTAQVMDGTINGNAVIATNDRNQSRVDADFTNLDLSKLLALQGGRVIPIAGNTSGKVNLTFPGTEFKAASGSLTADFTANAGTEDRGLVPVNGNLALRATNGLFEIDSANLKTERSGFNATGRFDLEGNDSNLNIALDSSDASEIERLIRVLNLSPELEEQLNSTQASFAGNLKFNGTLTGNLQDPTINGRATLDSLSLRGRNLGSLALNVAVSPLEINLRDGVLQEPGGGGNIAFNVNIPRTGENNITVQATLTRVNTGNLLAALPVTLPETLRDFQGQTSGNVSLSGLPKELNGEINLSSPGATVAGQSIDSFDARVKIQNALATIEKFDARFADGSIRANGSYQINDGVFNFDLEGKGLQLAKLRPLISKEESFPALAGRIDLNAKATGDTDDFSTFNVNFNGGAQEVAINEKPLGNVTFTGNTANQILTANLTASLANQPQVINATLNFGDPSLPFRAETTFNQTELEPYLAFLSPPENIEVSGKATGRVYLEGTLMSRTPGGQMKFTTENLSGEARFSQFSLLIGETPFVATDPLAVRFNMSEVIVENAQFSGGGSNVVVGGTFALAEGGTNNLSVDGKVNLRVLDVLSPNTFFTGIADVAVRLGGTNADPRLTGRASLANASFSTFVGSERISVNRINGRVLFNSNQAQIEQLTGYLGGGQVTATGGAIIGKGFQLQQHRIDLRGQNVTAPLTDGFIATADINLSTSGRLLNNVYSTDIVGNVVARRAIYTKDIDLADIIGNRREGSISAGTSSGPSMFGDIRLSIAVQARDTLIVRNNLAEVTASADLQIVGDINEPNILGRVTASRGTITFRNDRYEIQRAVVEFPPQNNGAPFVNIQAESEIRGYQVIVSLLGDLSNPDELSAVVRSNPGLPQADVISLITTGNLANTGEGIPTLAQSGINTAAEVLTDSLINDPLRKATDKLFGLNRFEIDPAISGRRLNPSARLTVGRQINRNLLVTYSTNLSEDQNQILAVEYRVSNRLSFVAQYEQRSLNNVTRNTNRANFEIRFRKRF